MKAKLTKEEKEILDSLVLFPDQLFLYQKSSRPFGATVYI
jgi:hypothetical protein